MISIVLSHSLSDSLSGCLGIPLKVLPPTVNCPYLPHMVPLNSSSYQYLGVFFIASKVH